MRRLTDGERDILRECEADARDGASLLDTAEDWWDVGCGHAVYSPEPVDAAVARIAREVGGLLDWQEAEFRAGWACGKADREAWERDQAARVDVPPVDEGEIPF